MAIPSALLWLGSRETDAGRTKLDDFLALGLNEMGDTIAGLAATLALLWLIVTAFMQRAELREQRRQLELATVESQRMAEALEAQAEVFRDEQRQRAEIRARRVLLRHLEQLVIFSSELRFENTVWARTRRKGTLVDKYEAAIPTIADRSVLIQGEASLGLAVREFCTQSVRLRRQLLENHLAEECERRPDLLPEHLEISLILNRILQLSSDLSEDDNIWLESLWLEQAAYAWSDLVGTEGIWSNMP